MIYVPLLQRRIVSFNKMAFFLFFSHRDSQNIVKLFVIRYSSSHPISDNFELWTMEKSTTEENFFPFRSFERDKIFVENGKGRKSPQLADYFLWLQQWKSSTIENSINIFFFFFMMKHYSLSHPIGKIVLLESRQFHATNFSWCLSNCTENEFPSEQRIENLLWTCGHSSLHLWRHLNEKYQ